MVLIVSLVLSMLGTLGRSGYGNEQAGNSAALAEALDTFVKRESSARQLPSNLSSSDFRNMAEPSFSLPRPTNSESPKRTQKRDISGLLAFVHAKAISPDGLPAALKAGLAKKEVDDLLGPPWSWCSEGEEVVGCLYMKDIWVAFANDRATSFGQYQIVPPGPRIEIRGGLGY